MFILVVYTNPEINIFFTSNILHVKDIFMFCKSLLILGFAEHSCFAICNKSIEFIDTNHFCYDVSKYQRV